MRYGPKTSNVYDKQMVEIQLFHKQKETPFTWADIKDLKLEDNDVIFLQWVEPYYSENNSYDGHFGLQITRMVPETQEQYEKRIAQREREKVEIKERKYQTFLKLKAEFEPENNLEKNLEEEEK